MSKVLKLRDSPVALTTATSAFNSVATVIAGIALARALGPSGRGQLAAMLLWASVAVDVASFGIPDSLAYFSAASPLRRRGVAAYCFARLPFIWAFSMLIFFAMASTSRRAAEEIPGEVFVIFVVWIAARSTSTMILRLAQGSSDFPLYNFMSLAAQAGPAVALFLLWRQEMLTLLIAGLVYTMGLFVVLVLGIWRRNVLAPQATVPTAAAAPAGFWRYSAWSAMSVIARKGNRTVDLFIITLVATAAETGTYAVAVSSSFSIVVVGTAIGVVLLPRTAGAVTPRSRSVVIRSLLKLGGVLVGGLGITYFVLAEVLIPLVYGSSFSAAVPLGRILVLGAAAVAISEITSAALRGVGKPRSVALSEVAGGGITVLLALGFARTLSGVAVAATIGYTATLAIQFVTLHQALALLADRKTSQ